MSKAQQDIRRKTRALAHAAQNGNIRLLRVAAVDFEGPHSRRIVDRRVLVAADALALRPPAA